MSGFVFGSWTAYRVSTTANANITQCRASRPRNTVTKILGHRQGWGEVEGGGAPTLFPDGRSAIGRALGRRRPVISALSPQPTSSQTRRSSLSRVPDMLCLSGHLDVHLVSRGVGLSILAPDGLALITTARLCVSPSRAARQLDLAATLEASEKESCWLGWMKGWLRAAARAMPQRGQKNKIITRQSCFSGQFFSVSQPKICSDVQHNNSKEQNTEVKL